MEFNAQQIAAFLQGMVEGDPDVKINNFSKIEEGKPNTISFLANPKYTHHIYDTNASVVLVNDDFVPEKDLPQTLTLIRVPDAYAALAQLLDMVDKSNARKKGIEQPSYISASAQLNKEKVYIGAFAYIGENVSLGEDVEIYPNAYVGDNVSIGDNTIVYAGAKIYAGCTIGRNCILHAGSVIGSDGFGFAKEGNVYKKIPQLGNVIIEDEVEVGANTTIDRAVMESTVIRRGVKLDNLIQIAHNVEVDENTAMAAQVGISGSTKVGRNCVIGGQVGLAGHINIGDNTSIGAQAGIMKDVPEGSRIIGSPAIDVNRFFRSNVVFNRLPEIYRQLNSMERDIENIKKIIKK